LLEKFSPADEQVIEQCRERLTAGNAKLDPALETEKLVTRWRLWVPQRWLKE
jgi:hypothetical protein